jgi:hypothetical protein
MSREEEHRLWEIYGLEVEFDVSTEVFAIRKPCSRLRRADAKSRLIRSASEKWILMFKF